MSQIKSECVADMSQIKSECVADMSQIKLECVADMSQIKLECVADTWNMSWANLFLLSLGKESTNMAAPRAAQVWSRETFTSFE